MTAAAASIRVDAAPAAGTTVRSPRASLDALTSLRFFAAFHVVLKHYGDALAPTPTVREAFLMGYSAVSCFFLLSGFILTYNYAEDLDARRVTLGDFFLARFARVYPLYALIACAELPFLADLPGVTPGAAVATTIAQLLLLQAWLQLYAKGNVAAWSIAVEAVFYALFPWISSWSARLKKPRSLMVGMAACWLVGPVVIWYSGRHGLPTGVLEYLLFFPLAHVPTFVAGVLLGRLHLSSPGTRGSWSGDVLALCGFAGLLTAYTTIRTPLPLYIAINAGLLFPLFALVIFGLARGRWLTHALSNPLLVRLGTASYAMYLLQQPLFYALERFHQPVEGAKGRLWFMLVLGVLSLASCYWIERPLQAQIRRRRGWYFAAARLSWRAALPAFAIAAAVFWRAGPWWFPSEPPVVIRYCFSGGARCGARAVSAVSEHGFHHDETLAGTPFRWTDGRAMVTIPVALPPRTLWFSLAGGPPNGTDVSVFANERPVWSGHIPTVATRTRVSLDGVTARRSLTVRIASPTWSPHETNPDSQDTRTLGVQVYEITVE